MKPKTRSLLLIPCILIGGACVMIGMTEPLFPYSAIVLWVIGLALLIAALAMATARRR